MVFLYNRSKLSDLFILQFVYFASCSHLSYFLQFILFYKLGPHSVHINFDYHIYVSDFIWPFLRSYMGVIPNPKMAFIFPISCILALIIPILIKYFPKSEGKGGFLKSQIKSLYVYYYTIFFKKHDPVK